MNILSKKVGGKVTHADPNAGFTLRLCGFRRRHTGLLNASQDSVSLVLSYMWSNKTTVSVICPCDAVM